MSDYQTKLARLLAENQLDTDRAFPDDLITQHFNSLPFQTQRMLIESQNTGRRYKPIDVRKYPERLNGAQVDPHDRKICPVCRLILNRALLRRTGNICPKCACRLSL